MRPFHVTADPRPETEAEKNRRKSLGNFIVVPPDLRMTAETAAPASDTAKTPFLDLTTPTKT
jgi:hypothetical protein